MFNRVWIKGFRNLKESVLTFDPHQPVVIQGDNNQGKTNFLEALYWVVSGKSPLTSTSENCIQFNQTEAVIVSDILADTENHRLSLKLAINNQKWGFINQKPIRSYRGITPKFPLLFLSSDLMYAFKESPQDRRLNLNHFCETIDPQYAKDLHYYEKIIHQKNRALKENTTTDYLNLWNQQLVEYALKLAQRRIQALQVLQDNYQSLVHNTAFKEPITLVYSESLSQYKEKLVQKLKENSEKEKMAGYSLYGPHREDYDIRMESRSIFEFYSRGINKMVAFLLTLAQREEIAKQSNRYPVLLLDDTFSEMGNKMKQELISLIQPKTQIFYTTVIDQDKGFFQNGQNYRMHQGELTRG